MEGFQTRFCQGPAWRVGGGGGISRVTIWAIQVINLLTKSKSPSKWALQMVEDPFWQNKTYIEGSRPCKDLGSAPGALSFEARVILQYRAVSLKVLLLQGTPPVAMVVPAP